MTSKHYASLSVTIHRGLGGLVALERDWRRLTEHDERYWIQFAFFRQLLVHSIHGPEAVDLIAVRDRESRVVAVVPVRRTRIPIRRVEFDCVELFGSTFDDVTCQASSADFPIAPDVSADRVLRAVTAVLRQLPDAPSLLLLGRLTDGSRCLTGALALHRRRHSHATSGGHKWLDVTCTFEEIRSRLAGKFKISLRSCRRNLQVLGRLEWNVSTPSSPNFSRDFEAFLQIESSGWKGRQGTATGLLVNHVENQRAFIRSLVEGAISELGEPEVHSLTLDGRPIAAQFWLRTPPTRIAFKIGYLEEYARYQPGHLLFESIIQQSCADPMLRSVDFVSDAAWLDKWRVAFSPHHHHYLPVSPSFGVIADCLLRLPSGGDIRERLRRRAESH